MDHDDLITRRQALSRVAILLGGAISAPTLAGALDAATRRAWTAPGPDWAPRTLDPGQLELVAVMADHIIPQTDTPGARAAGVHRFVDTLLSDHYPTPERDRFLAGLADVDAQARSRQGKTFVECTADRQVALLTEMDEAAYPAVPIDSPRPPETWRSEEHTSELQSHVNIVCRLLLEKKKKRVEGDVIQRKKERDSVTTRM